MAVEENRVKVGKIRRQRIKFHLPGKGKPSTNYESLISNSPALPLLYLKENIFDGVDIDISTIKNSLAPDLYGINFYKSLNTETAKRILSKKDRLNLKKQFFLDKIDTVHQKKKEALLRQKREKIALIGDTNPLHDALPSLKSLSDRTATAKYNSIKNKKKRGIEKATRRKKTLVEGVNIYKRTLKNKNFKENPFEAISGHIKAVVENDRKNNASCSKVR